MKRYLALLLVLLSPVLAGEPAYPLWDGTESVADYAKRLNLPPTKTLDLGGGVKMELVLIPAGKFVMGTPEPTPVDEDGFHKKIVTGQVLFAVSGGLLLLFLIIVAIQSIRQRRRPQFSLARLMMMVVAAGGCMLSGLHWRQSAQALEKARIEYPAAKARFESAEPVEKPAHPVTLTKAFYMGKFDVTQLQYQQIQGTYPSVFAGHKDNPVENISWNDAQDFCKKLTAQAMQDVRLPTEAEWEYACRAGTCTAYYSGDGARDLVRAGWWSYENRSDTTHPVGQKEPNAFGLYDMHGNVWQWCQDRYRVYSAAPATDPKGSDQGADCVLRGGCVANPNPLCRSAYRYRYPENSHGRYIGFRVVVPALMTP